MLGSFPFFSFLYISFPCRVLTDLLLTSPATTHHHLSLIIDMHFSTTCDLRLRFFCFVRYIHVLWCCIDITRSNVCFKFDSQTWFLHYCSDVVGPGSWFVVGVRSIDFAFAMYAVVNYVCSVTLSNKGRLKQLHILFEQRSMSWSTLEYHKVACVVARSYRGYHSRTIVRK